jgi:hypothetical protein
MRWTMPWRTLALSCVALCFPGAYSQSNTADPPAASQQRAADATQSPLTLRTNTRLVVVDVVTVDSKGQPVPDLKAADFTLLEDGKPQKISGFNFEHPGGRPTPAVQVQLPPSSGNERAKVSVQQPERDSLRCR